MSEIFAVVQMQFSVAAHAPAALSQWVTCNLAHLFFWTGLVDTLKPPIGLSSQSVNGVAAESRSLECKQVLHCWVSQEVRPKFTEASGT